MAIFPADNNKINKRMFKAMRSVDSMASGKMRTNHELMECAAVDKVKSELCRMKH